MKKTWKRLGALFLAVAMTLTLLPTAAFAATVTEPSGIADTTLVDVANMEATGPNPYTGEGYDKLKDSESTTHYGSWNAYTDENDRYVQITLTEEVWLSGLYWMNRGASNGAVTKYAILVSVDETNWYPVADNRSGDAWVKTDNTWNTAVFDCPVKTKYVKVLGVETQSNYISCAELRLATPNTTPETRSVIGTVKDGNGSALEGVTVVIGGRGTTTTEGGTFTISDLPKNYKYAVTATKDGYAQYDGSVESGESNVADLEITLVAPSATISGKVTDAAGDDGGTKALVGAKVGLVQDVTGYPIVENKEAITVNEGAYTLDMTGLNDGSYKIRVSMAGYGTLIGQGSITVKDGKAITSVTDNDASLIAIGTDYTYGWTFDDAASQPKQGSLSHTDNTNITYANGAMKLAWTSGDRSKNLVNINNTNAKNCIIEFDATRGTESIGNTQQSPNNSIRFGVALRSHTIGEGSAEKNYWIYVGQESAASGNGWGIEAFQTTSTANYGGGYSYSSNGPAFKAGETRHFKIEIKDDTITMTVDGVEVVNKTNLTSLLSNGNVPATELNVAGDVGLIWGNSDMTTVGGHTITVDNLYVFRTDPQKGITKGENNASDAATLEISYTDNGEEYKDLEEVPAGSIVKVTAVAENNKALGDVTVTNDEDNNSTVNAADIDLKLNDGGQDDEGNEVPDYFTFVMPAYAVTVTGTLKDTFKVKLPYTTADNGDETENTPKVNRDYTVELTDAQGDKLAGTAADYQWYRVSSGAEDVEVGENSATYTPDTADVGKYLKVVVTGKESYTGIHTLTTANPVAAADTEVTGVTLDKSEVTLWMNEGATGENKGTPGSTTLTATISPSNATNPKIEWEVKNADGVTEKVVELQESTDGKTATITAAGNGTATVTVTVTSADGETKKSAECTVTVGTKPTGVTVNTVVADGGQPQEVTVDNPLILYSNTDGTTVKYYDYNAEKWVDKALNNSAMLAFDVAPDSHTNGDEITNTRTSTNYDVVSRGVASSEGYTFSVGKPGPNTVGEETFTINFGTGTNATELGKFRIVVLRWLVNTPEIVVKGGGQPRPNATLTVNPDSLDAPADEVYIYWFYEGEAEDGSEDAYLLTETDENGNEVAKSSAEYTLKPEDIGKKIYVLVMAVENYDTKTDAADRCYYTGDVYSDSITVLPAAAPAAPELKNVVHVDSDTKGSITITISGPAEGETYEYEYSSDGGKSWKDVENNGVIAELEAGTYQVRVKEKEGAYEAGEVATVTIQDESKDYWTVSVTETPPEGGTAVPSADSVEDGASVTLTVNPAVGYEIKSVKVKGSDEELEGTAETDGMVYTVENATAAVEFIVTYAKIKLTITHDLKGLKCDLPDVHDDNVHTVEYGTVETITLSLADDAEEGLVLPGRDGIKIVTVKGDQETPFTDFSYENGKITFRSGVTQDLKITAEAQKVTYTVYFDLTRLSVVEPLVAEAYPGQDYTATLKVQDGLKGWVLPASVTVRRGTVTLEAGTDYTYQNGTITVKKEAVTGNLAIIASAQMKTTEVESVTIDIGHQDTGVGDKNVPHVNDVLSAVVSPTGSSVSYAWYVDGIEQPVGDQKNLTVTQNYVGKTITVKITGTGLFSGEKTSAPTAKVGAEVKLPTSIALNPKSSNMNVGESLVLTATIDPNDATDKAITWKVLAATSDTEVSGVVDVTNHGDGTATIKAVAPGRVRINVSTSNGHSDNCILNIERANSYALSYQLIGEAGVTIQANGERVSNGGRIEANTPVTITVEPTDSEHKAAIIVTAGSTSVNAEKGDDGYVWKFNMPATDTEVAINVGADVKPVEGVTLNKNTLTLKTGESERLVATIEPEDADNQNVTWESSNRGVATVGDTGTVTGVSAGTTTITVTANGGVTATCEVTVTEETVTTTVPVTGVTLNKTTLDLTVNQTYTLTATIDPEDATNPAITWKSGDDSIASVSSGVVTAHKAGTTTITVTTEDGNKTATCTVTVTGTATVSVGSVEVTAPGGVTTYYFAAGGTETVQLTATVGPVGANPAVTWETSDANIATVSSTGLVTITGTGDVTITAKSDEDPTKSGSIALHIETAAVRVTGVSLPESDTIRVNGTATLIPTFTPANAVNKDVVWESTDNTVASVSKDADGNGLVTALSVGTTTIKVTTVDGGHTATCAVEVVAADAPITVTGVTVNYDGGDISLLASGTTQVTLTATVQPSAADQRVTWSSGSEDIATVDENGVVTVKTTGTVTITATSVADSTKSGSRTLNIVTVAVTGVSLDETEIGLAAGETQTLTATVAPANASDKAATWTSSDTSVATVDATGKVTAVAAGTATIKVKTNNGGFEATCTVTVTAADNPTPVVPIIPSNPSETITNPDGSTTTTVTDAATGTVTETTEKPDGTVETKETLKDGTVTETVTNPDGSSESVETKPDGTVTETAIDAEGAKVEKVTTPEEDVTITVTDKDGEELAKVELPAEIPEPETRFVDVPEGHWADTAIHNMAALEVVKGTGDDRYDMNSSMTRGALATVLSRLSNGKEGLTTGFADVDADQWYADGIAWAARTGVVTGYSETEFGPNDAITREQLAVMLCRYARLLGMDTAADTASLDGFTDGSSTDSWATDSIAWCVEKGIINGMGDGTVAPTATATRAQVAVMLQRFIDLMK